VFGAGETADLGEDRERGEGDNGSHAGDGLEPSDRFAALARAVAETHIERADPLGRLPPYGVMMAHMLLELFGRELAIEQVPPARVAAQAAASPAVLADSAQQPFDRVDLGGLDTDEVAAAG
jgi:hypothetical protein